MIETYDLVELVPFFTVAALLNVAAWRKLGREQGTILVVALVLTALLVFVFPLLVYWLTYDVPTGYL